MSPFSGFIENHRGLIVGGAASFALGGGKNTWNSNVTGSADNFIGGYLVYTGGANIDEVNVDRTTVVMNVSVSLGNSNGVGQHFSAGYIGEGGMNVLGSLKLVGGIDNDGFALRRVNVGKALTVLAGGGNDDIEMDDTSIGGASLFDLGAGDDDLEIDTFEFDGGGKPLYKWVSFTGALTVLGGAGADTVNFSHDFQNNTNTKCVAKVTLIGGIGLDTYKNAVNNEFSTGNIEDFEGLVRTGLPV